MGSVCSAIASAFAGLGRGISAIISGIASCLMAVVNGIAGIFASFFQCLGDVLCCRCGGRGRRR